MKKRLAIVSSYNESCGNASYTHVLRNAFAEHVEVEVIPLDLFLLQKKGPFYESFGDRHIDEIAQKLKTFDYVNLQFEGGLYGPSIGLMLRRITKLIRASQRVVVTMHRIDPPEVSLWQGIRQVLQLEMHPRDLLPKVRRHAYAMLYRDVVNICKQEGRHRHVSVAVHTPRELRIVRDLYSCTNAFLYPITFLNAQERKEILSANSRDAFRARHHIPEGVKAIGAFGFVSAYKAYDTIIRALDQLPDHYHLYIFGAQHPQSIRPNVAIDPYFHKLMQLMQQLDVRARKHVSHVKEKEALTALKISERVHFVGALSDQNFIEALRFCDATVLPYMEVGQSMSGVISIAIEAGANLFCSNNHSFNEVRKMYGEVYHSFDIGNYMELAEKIRIARNDYAQERDRAYAKYNIRGNVLRHLEALGHFESA